MIVTIQAKLLGGRVSFLQALCVLGYCVAPLDAAALVACFVSKIWIRVPVVLGAWAWCVWCEWFLRLVRSENGGLMSRTVAWQRLSISWMGRRLSLQGFYWLFIRSCAYLSFPPLLFPYPRRPYKLRRAQVILLHSRMDDPYFLKILLSL